MFSHSTLRLLRRLKIVIPAICILCLLFALASFDSSLQPAVPWNSFSGSKISPFYDFQNTESPYYQLSTPSFFPPIESLQSSSSQDLCAGFPAHLLSRIQVVLKTGTGELAKTKAHGATDSSCITNILAFSDLDETVNGRHFIDVLADLPASYAENEDFAAYAKQKQAHAEGKSVGYSSEGWKLDRFKFLPMVDKAYKMRPNAEWYVFIETDVYYFWDTLFRLLTQLDSSKMHYMGSPAPGRDGTLFAYGGAGFVISRGLMKQLMGGSTQLSVEFEEEAKSDCCGDAILGTVIRNKTDQHLQALYPTFAGDELLGLKVDAERWCVPLLALHRVGPEQMKTLWEWERRRPYNEDPFTHSTIADYLFSTLPETSTRTSWDNYAGDAQPEGSPAHSSLVACRGACSHDNNCLQYSFSEGICRFGTSYQVGRPKPDVDYVSGWDTEKMASLGYNKDPKKSSSCKTATWLKPVVR